MLKLPLINAFGNRQITCQTDRGRVLSSTAVLSASFGDVFSDTAQQNGVVNVTLNQYDGLDRRPGGEGTKGYGYYLLTPNRFFGSIRLVRNEDLNEFYKKE